MAVNLQAPPRTTGDIDLLIDLPAVLQPAFLNALQQRGAVYGELETGPDVWRIRTQEDLLRDWAQTGLTWIKLMGVRVDLLRPIDPLHRQAIDDARTLEWDGRPVRVSPPETLILGKLIAGRGKDLDDVRRLATTWRGKLDRSKIDSWLPLIERAGGTKEADARRYLDPPS